MKDDHLSNFLDEEMEQIHPLGEEHTTKVCWTGMSGPLGLSGEV